jgi:hypothetical protein
MYLKYWRDRINAYNHNNLISALYLVTYINTASSHQRIPVSLCNILIHMNLTSESVISNQLPQNSCKCRRNACQRAEHQKHVPCVASRRRVVMLQKAGIQRAYDVRPLVIHAHLPQLRRSVAAREEAGLETQLVLLMQGVFLATKTTFDDTGFF